MKHHIKTSRSVGVSLLEVMLALAVVGIMAGVFSRLLVRKTDPRPEFIGKLNVLTRTAWVTAMESGVLHRVKFDELTGNNPRILVQRAKQTGDQAVTGSFEDVSAPGITRLAIPKSIQVAGLVINREDQGGDLKNAWFFVAPDGTMQDVQMSLSSDSVESQPIQLTLDSLGRRFVNV